MSCGVVTAAKEGEWGWREQEMNQGWKRCFQAVLTFLFVRFRLREIVNYVVKGGMHRLSHKLSPKQNAQNPRNFCSKSLWNQELIVSPPCTITQKKAELGVEGPL